MQRAGKQIKTPSVLPHQLFYRHWPNQRIQIGSGRMDDCTYHFTCQIILNQLKNGCLDYQSKLCLIPSYLTHYNLKMFLGMGGRDRDQTASTCWTNLQFGYKSLFVFSLGACLITSLFSSIAYYIPNIILLTINEFQIWRLITSFIVNGPGFSALISVLFYFYMLYITVPDLERKYSTAYILLQTLIQTLTVNLAIVAIGWPLVQLGLTGQQGWIGYGVLHLVLIFMFRRAAAQPNEPTRFCFFPCLIEMRYIPWCYLLLLVLFGSPFLTCTLYAVVGYYQALVAKRSIIQLPLSAYRKFDSWMPNSIKERTGYVKVSSVEGDLRTVCRDGGCFESFRNDERNPFAGRAEPIIEDRIGRVDVLGGGVSIGGENIQPSQQADFRSHWLRKDQNEDISGQNVPRRPENEPKPIPNLLDEEQDTNESMLSDHPFKTTGDLQTPLDK